MAFSSGTFSLYSPGNPVVTGTTIQSSWANNTLTDIATGLTTCLLKDGSQTVTANIPLSGFKLTGLGAATTNGDALRYQQLFTAGTVTLLGELALGGFKVSGLGAATTAGDALRFEQLFSTSAVTLLGEIRYTAGAGLTAAGTGQSDALQLAAAINQVTTAAASTGVKLYASPAAGSWQLVYNGGANPMKVYPQTSGTINGLAANAGMILPIKTSCMFYAASTTAWIGILSA